MVRIIEFKTITGEDNKDFNMLVLQGGIEPMLSQKTGRTYLTMRKASISTTFDAATCKSLIGAELPGNIHKVACEPYEYTVAETSEVLTLDYRWQYIDEDFMNANKQIIDKELVN